jgi:endonuclease I
MILLAYVASLKAQVPAGYYNNANGKTGTALKQALHDIIDDHTTISYAQIWNAFVSTDNKGNNEVWDMYSDGADYTYYYNDDQCGEYHGEGDCYNREHSWPQSWFKGDDQSVPGRDLHHIFPTDGYINQQRGNLPFGEVNSATTAFQNGSKLGNCKSSLGYTGEVFEPIDEYKGDFARALMYMSVRYYTEDDNWGTSAMTNKSEIKSWAIEMLLDWNDQDQVSQKEIDRNNEIYNNIQHNRNPFIDHPEYARLIWDPTYTTDCQIAVAANPEEGGEVGVTTVFTTTATIDFSVAYSNVSVSQSVDGVDNPIDDNVKVVFNKKSGSAAPTYYKSGTSVRCYANNNFVVSAANSNILIKSITLTYTDNATITTDVGSFDGTTWTGSSSSVTFTLGSSGQRRIKTISVTYSVPSTPAQQLTVTSGTTVKLTASANTGYHFVNWTKGGVEVSTENPYSFAVSASGTYVANFELNIYDIYVSASPSAGGVVYIGDAPTPGGSTTVSKDFSTQGYENGEVINNVSFDSNIDVVFNKGTNSNPPKYYDVGSAIRCYGGNYFTVSSSAGNITSIVFTFASGEDSNAINPNVGTYNSNTKKWTGEASSVIFTIGGTSGHRRVRSMSVTYSTPGTPAVTHTTVAYGNTASITAVPNDGYFFTTWTENNTNTVVSTDASCEVTVTEDMTYQANFIPATISENTTIQSLTMGESKTLTINSGVTLTVTGTITQASDATILIKDGTNGMGQLVNSTANINATVEKNITAWTTTPSKSGWHAISTPVNNVAFADVTNLRSSDYNVYRLNETNLTWENCNYNSNVFSSFDNGRGYIYRKGDNQTIAFNGDLNATDVTYPLTYTSSTTKGFHLIGNPYPHNIYKGDGAAIPNTYLEDGFYTITSAGGFVPGIDEATPIAPCEAILVQALNTVTDEDLIITKTTATGAKKDFDDNIMFAVSNSNYEDVAYAVFKKGHGLNKIEHRNEDIQMLYVQQNGEDFAIANIDENVQMFNLNFRAATIGKYTLKAKPIGDFGYLHLIDNLTGEDVDLLMDDEYSFIASSKDKENRFIVKFRRDDACIASNDEIFAYQNGNEIVVDGEGELQIFDIMGRLVVTRHVNGVETVEKPYQSGVYILRLVGEETRIQKIIVK